MWWEAEGAAVRTMTIRKPPCDILHDRSAAKLGREDIIRTIVYANA